MQKKYNSYEDLNPGIQNRIKQIAGADIETWLRKPVPALDNKSILELLNEDDGYQKVCKYLTKVEGFLF